MMTNRGGKICLAAFPHDPIKVNIPYMVINNIYMYGIRGEGKSATHRAMAVSYTHLTLPTMMSV